MPLLVDIGAPPDDVKLGISQRHFTSGADRSKVISSYDRFRQMAAKAVDEDVHYFLHPDNNIERWEDILARHDAPLFAARGRHAYAPLLSNEDQEPLEVREQRREEAHDFAAKMESVVEVLLHTVPIGLVQMADYVSDLFVLVQLRDDGDDDSFVVGRFCVVASIITVSCSRWLAGAPPSASPTPPSASCTLPSASHAAVIAYMCRPSPSCRFSFFWKVWLIFIVMPIRNGAFVWKHGFWVCLLAPLNLHVLYFGLRHAELHATHGDQLPLYKRR